MINISNIYSKQYITQSEEQKYVERLKKIKTTLAKKESMLDWYDIETTVTKSEIVSIKSFAKEIRANCDVFIILGIGGSFLGAQAVINALTPYFDKPKPEIIFAGTDLSCEYLSEVIKHIENKSIYLNVISKSGTTMETTLAFNELESVLKRKYGDEYKKRIIITTDKEKGKLREKVVKENIRSLIVPSNIGGRYSVLSPVGLLPIAVSGINIDKLLIGAKKAKGNIDEAMKYAVYRDILYKKHFFVEAITVYEKKYTDFARWAQQLFGESQGKNKKGILPIDNLNTTNLHSIGQYLQDGSQIVFETVLKIDANKNIKIKGNNISFGELGKIVETQVAVAHQKGGTPTLEINIGKLNEESLGELIYFYFIASATGGYLLDINPFDQPGVELYKQEIKNKIILK